MIWSRGCLICCSRHSGSQYKVSTDVKKKKKTSHSHFSLRICFCRTLKTSLCLQCFCSPTFRPHTGHRRLCVRVNGGLVNSTREHGGDRCSQWQIHSDPEGQNWGLFETRIEVFHCIKQIKWISNQIYLTFSAQTLLKCNRENIPILYAICLFTVVVFYKRYCYIVPLWGSRQDTNGTWESAFKLINFKDLTSQKLTGNSCEQNHNERIFIILDVKYIVI